VRTYKDVFALAEFRAIFAGQVASAAAMTIQTLAFSVLVYTRTASPLLTAVAFLAGSVPQALGAVTLSGVSDRRPPRSVLVASDAVRALTFLLLATGVMPVAGLLGVVMLSGVASGALAGIRFALLTQVLPIDSYILGRSALNSASAGMQVVGYAVGGGILVTVGARGGLWIAAGLATAACVIDRCGVRVYPAASRTRSSVADTWRATQEVLSDGLTGRLMLAQWVPNGLIVGAEALFIPYARHRAAILFTAAAAGLLAGDLVAGRLIPTERRAGVASLFYLLLGVPYLAFVLRPPLWLALVLVTFASMGFGGTLCVQQLLVQAVSRERLGQVFALSSAGMLTVQGLAAYLAGGMAELLTPAQAMAVMAIGSLLATAALLMPLRGRGRRACQRQQPETSIRTAQRHRQGVELEPAPSGCRGGA
jgi:MFS family permease